MAKAGLSAVWMQAGADEVEAVGRIGRAGIERPAAGGTGGERSAGGADRDDEPAVAGWKPCQPSVGGPDDAPRRDPAGQSRAGLEPGDVVEDQGDQAPAARGGLTRRIVRSRLGEIERKASRTSPSPVPMAARTHGRTRLSALLLAPVYKLF